MLKDDLPDLHCPVLLDTSLQQHLGYLCERPVQHTAKVKSFQKLMFNGHIQRSSEWSTYPEHGLDSNNVLRHSQQH